MMKIAIHGAEFFAYHGFYPEEQKLGNRFMVDMEVSFEPKGNINDDEIANTVDYQQLYRIINEQMKQTRKLIETVAQAILEEVKSTYPYLQHIEIVLKKMNPLLGCKIAHSSITINYKA